MKVFDKSERTDGTLSRSDFAYDAEANIHVCPGGKELKKHHRNFSKPRNGLTKAGALLYFARKHDCDACAVKPKCCPNMPARKISRPIMKRLATRPEPSPKRRPTRSHAESGRSSRCCLRTSSAR